MWKFTNTQQTMVETLKNIRKQCIAIEQALHTMDMIQAGGKHLPSDAKYEVSFQARSGDHHSVKTSGDKIGDAYHDAVMKWKALNSCSIHKQHGQATVFIVTDKYRFALNPDDVVSILHSEGVNHLDKSKFMAQHELTEIRGKIIWNVDERLPGWHADQDTPHQPSVKLVALAG